MSNDTPCKNCCFAIYDEITQIGCARNRIEKYTEAGSEIIEAYDEEKEFFVIKNRICPYYRDQKWLDKFKGDQDSSIEKTLKFETTLSIHLIILFKPENTLEQIEETVRSLDIENCRTSPVKVTIIKNIKTRIKVSEIKEIFTGLPVFWRVEGLIVEMDDSRAINMVQKTINSQYYCVCNAGFKFPKNYFGKINDEVIDNLLQFGMLIVDDENDLNGVVIPRNVHSYWYFHGNLKKTIPENIKEYQCQNPQEKVIVKFKNL